ncbi:hypothetical protein V6N13_012540 [Hibiscus sabdariffa]
MRKGCSKLFYEDERQFERWDHTALRSFKAEFKRFKDVVVLSLMHPWERDARLLKKALKKGPQQYNVIIEIVCTRSSDQLLGARKAYHSLFDQSIEEDLASHINGSERKFFMALVSAYRYEGSKVKEDSAISDAKALLNAIKNVDKRKAVEDDEVVRILTTRSKLHLKEVCEQYKKLSDKAIIEIFDAALRDDANEDAKKALTRLIATQESGEIKRVATKFEGKIEDRVKGAYKDVLIAVLAK